MTALDGPRGRGRPPRLSAADKHEVRRYREAGVSIAHLAGMFRISTTRVYEILREQRERFGPEKFPDTKRHLRRLHLFSGQLVQSASATCGNNETQRSGT